ncbi:MAG: DMT family transporter [Cohaesibacter sp.]|nr:DMT family transporter [Cohaesibacter sp.]MCV6602568.1 DMT family transporter [Cohaesibacter sp.]
MSSRLLAYWLLLFSPVFFSSNLIIGSLAVKSIEPFTLSLFRWSIAFCLIVPFAWAGIWKQRAVLRDQWRLIAFNGFLSVGICGAGVYFALKYTSATNGTLIYTSSPVMILLMERLFRGRPIAWREVIGILLAIAGILYIIAKGHLTHFLKLNFNAGDLLFVMAALGWAIYSVLSKKRVLQPVSTISMFSVVAFTGALIMVPFALYEASYADFWPTRAEQWYSLLGLGFVSSVLAFICYQYGIKILGPSTAGIFMYLLPPVGVLLAVGFLEEEFLAFHMVGLVLVMSGVVLATLPYERFIRSKN